MAADSAFVNRIERQGFCMISGKDRMDGKFPERDKK